MIPAWNAAAPPPPAPGTQPPPGYASYNMSPAYTQVHVRQNFAPSPQSHYPAQPGYGVQYNSTNPANTPSSVNPAPPAPQAAQESAKAKVQWPDSVRQYVQRAFTPSSLDPTVTRLEMETKLKETISHANDTGVLYTVDWANMPLPQEIIKQERLRSLALQQPKPAETKQESWTNGTSVNSKKRKSSEFNSDGSTSTAAPPWRKSSSLGDRISHPSPEKRQAIDESSKSKFQKQLEKRQRRFDGGYKSTYQHPSPSPEPANTGPIVGTSENLEKKYLRLTSAPNPANVRPERILRMTLELLKKKWRKENNYSYICDQFKSMRQDLTVQRIKNEFTVSVYEIHARIALEKGDLGEYNQCQTQLKGLYKLGLKGNPLEFKAYRILYFIHTANRAALSEAMKDLTTAEKAEPAIKHALAVRSSLALGNYHRFFRLYMDTPNMGAYLMDMFVERERLAALANICKAYKPDVRLRFITEELGFESDGDAAQFILDHNGQHLLEERTEVIVFLTGKASSLFEEARKQAFSKVDIKGQI